VSLCSACAHFRATCTVYSKPYTGSCKIRSILSAAACSPSTSLYQAAKENLRLLKRNEQRGGTYLHIASQRTALQRVAEASGNMLCRTGRNEASHTCWTWRRNTLYQLKCYMKAEKWRIIKNRKEKNGDGPFYGKSLLLQQRKCLQMWKDEARTIP
jgi:hypothetical protein